MNTSRRVLISGAGIAGPALAYWLDRYGWETTVVERASALRTGGQNVDVRGAGREVSRRMGIEDGIREATTGEVGTRFIGVDGRVTAEFPVDTDDSDGPTAELEVLRGDLARILVETTTPDVSYAYGREITAVEDESGREATVTFGDGEREAFDLVVVAEGVRSRTRDLVFGDGVRFEPLGLYMAYLTIPREAEDDDWWRWYSTPGGRTVTLRPDNEGTIRATLAFLSPGEGYEDLATEEQKAVLGRAFEDAGGVASRILRALGDASNVYLEYLGRIHAPSWHAGRVALVGDAAYCATPISGMGTSLALVGAYVLAGELAAHTDHRDALGGYERIMRPYVEQAQDLPPGVPRLAYPKTRIGTKAFDLAVRLASTDAAQSLGERFATPTAEKIDLPDYAHLEEPER